MSRRGVRWRHAGLVAAALALDGCAGYHLGSAGDIHAFPDNYKADILGAMHAYLNDPTGIRDASIAAPVLKDAPGSGTRYIVCLRFNGKQRGGVYAGEQQIAAVFLAGRFDEFLDPKTAHEPCAGAVYAAFPELETLKQ